MCQDKIKIFIPATIIAIFVVPWLNLSLDQTLLLLVLYYLTLIIALFQKYSLFILILVRPSLDILSSHYFFNFFNYTLSPAVYFGLIGIIICSIIIFKNRKKIINLPALKILAFFLAAILISSFYSFDKNISFLEFIRLLSIYLIYATAFVQINSKEKFKRLIKAIIFSTILPVAVALYQFFNQTGLTVPFEGVANRIFGTFAHPNLFAYFLVLPVTLIIINSTFKKENFYKDFFYYIIGLLGLIALTLTYTRGAWLALIIVLIAIGVYRFKKILIIGIITVIMIYVFIEPIYIRINNTFTDKYSSINWRINYWQEVYGDALTKPIFGHGAGSAENFYLAKWGDKFAEEAAIHNDYVKLFFENGLIGLGLYLSIIITLLILLYKKFKSAVTNGDKIISLSIISLSLAIFALSSADNILRDTALMWSYWAYLGGIFGYKK